VIVTTGVDEALDVNVPPVCVYFVDADAVEEVDTSNDVVTVLVEETLDEGMEVPLITVDIVFTMDSVKKPLAEGDTVFVRVTFGECVGDELIVAVIDDEYVLELVDTALEVRVAADEVDADGELEGELEELDEPLVLPEFEIVSSFEKDSVFDVRTERVRAAVFVPPFEDEDVALRVHVADLVIVPLTDAVFDCVDKEDKEIVIEPLDV